MQLQTAGKTQLQTERCPWCDSVVSRAKFLAIRNAIRVQEREKLEAAEAAVRKQMEARFKKESEVRAQAADRHARAAAAKQLAALSAERDLLTKKVKEADAREAQIRKRANEEVAERAKTFEAEIDRRRQKEIGEMRVILQKEQDKVVLKHQADFNREREGYQKKIKEMDRQLLKRSANDIGDGAEIDLYETLRDAFPKDQFKRIQKGETGADIWQDVVYKGESCGRIVFDSKNRQSWQYSFVTKLRQDQVEADAEHAILCTTVFPSGKKELCIEESVIVVSPARVVYIVEVLRNAMIRLRTLGLSMKARADKMSRLYQFITSDTFLQRFREVEAFAEKVLELDVEEQKDHQKVWKERGRLMIRQKNLLRDLDTEISAIVEGSGNLQVQSA